MAPPACFRRARLSAAALPRPVRALPLGRRARSRLGRDANRRAQQGTDPAPPDLDLYRTTTADRRRQALSLLLEHDHFRKPEATFRDHALESASTSLSPPAFVCTRAKAPGSVKSMKGNAM